MGVGTRMRSGTVASALVLLALMSSSAAPAGAATSPLVARQPVRRTSESLSAGGAITFAPHQDVTVDGGAGQVAIADLNGDHLPDLVVPIFQSFGYDAGVAVLLGNGDGTFQDPAYSLAVCSGGGRGVTGVAIGDFTGDGIPDIAEALNCASEVDVLPGNGDGTFGSPIVTASSGNATSIVAANLNGDGILDVVIGTVGPGGADPARIEVLFGDGDGTFSGSPDCNQLPLWCYPFDNTYGSAQWLSARDLNGDGAPDIVATGQTCGTNAGLLAVYLNNGDGTLQDEQPYLQSGCPRDAGIADFTGDGTVDLATTTGQTLQSWRAVDLLAGTGGGSFGGPQVTSTSLFPYFVASADFNVDGRPDLAGADGSACQVDVYAGSGSGAFGSPSAFATTCGQPTTVTAGDLNGDRRPDLVTTEYDSCCSGFSFLSILLNSSQGPLKIATSSLSAGTVGQPYAAQLSAAGGKPPYSWSIRKGLPGTSGLKLDPLFTNCGLCVIDGTPQFGGTYNVTIKVTDSSTPTPQSSQMTFPLTVNASACCPQWNLKVAGHPPPPSGDTGPVVANPHVALVLVGQWWCPLFGSTPPPGSICPGGNPGSATEQSGFVAAVSGLVNSDYSSEYDDALASFYQVRNGVTTYVGHGMTLRTYSPYGGTPWAGPVQASDVTPANLSGTLTTVSQGFGVSSHADIADTIFVLLFAPNLLPGANTSSCNNVSGNGPSGAFRTAAVYLEDAQFSCAFEVTTGLGSLINPSQFATFATSHELDEAITDPTLNSLGWLVFVRGIAAQQIGDVCEFRNADGETWPIYDTSGYPFRNYTRDSLGTVVAAYVSPTGSHLCTPNVSTSIPPG